MSKHAYTTVDINVEPAYKVHIGKGLLQDKELIAGELKGTERPVIITESRVYELYGKILQAHLADKDPLLLVFPAGEEQKNRQTKADLEDQMLAAGCNRDSCIFALGGGVVSDLAGFIAATYCRGIPMVYLPTTLLAMVDAAVGGKTAVNTPFGKNMIGAFHQPRSVFMDVASLESLPPSEINGGFAEMLKHALIDEKELLQDFKAQFLKKNSNQHWLLQNSEWFIQTLARSVISKKKHVEADEQDRGRRHALNFGHTIGHAIELLSNYQIGHGRAVAIGTLVESYICLQEKTISAADFAEIKSCLELCDFSLQTPVLGDFAGVLHSMKLDKKATASSIRFALLDGLGATIPQTTKAIDQEKILQALEWYQENYL